MSGAEVHGHAILSDDDCIADASGATPQALRNEADWKYFQRELDLADLTALGRLGHEANPNAKGRARLVLSHGARGLERRGDAWWWNPAQVPWAEASARLLPKGGRVAVPGGRKVFGACGPGASAEDLLRRAGLRAGAAVALDAAANVALNVWRRA